jgi:hypothetical protein
VSLPVCIKRSGLAAAPGREHAVRLGHALEEVVNQHLSCAHRSGGQRCSTCPTHPPPTTNHESPENTVGPASGPQRTPM